MTRKMKSRDGFNLAELLLVMGVVVVLAAIAVPTFSGFLENSRETEDLHYIRIAYDEALTIGVLDAADGVLDARNGSVSLKDALGSDSVTASDGVLSCMVWLIRPMRQSTPGWRYVKGYVQGAPVSDANRGDVTATFKFTMSGADSSLTLANSDADPISISS